ncbi:MAG: hypothetical protein PHE75_07980, partial [Candidatus Cloacimonas acidaminovorans]|nr:hypothetical protein [Candidatus Cloacimonas acidaminovorans]
ISVYFILSHSHYVSDMIPISFPYRDMGIIRESFFQQTSFKHKQGSLKLSFYTKNHLQLYNFVPYNNFRSVCYL